MAKQLMKRPFRSKESCFKGLFGGFYIVKKKKREKKYCRKTCDTAGLTCQCFTTVLTIQEGSHGDFLEDKNEQTF